MDTNEEVEPEQIEDYCRQLGLQIRDEQENLNVDDASASQTTVLGASEVAPNSAPSNQPIAAGEAKLVTKEKRDFECKKCEKTFKTSRQFLKHKCVLNTEKSKAKQRGRKPKVTKKSEWATEPVSDEVNTSKAESLIDDQIGHLSDHTYIKDGEISLNTVASDGKNIQCESCQLLAELDPESANNLNKIPCEKCQELTADTLPATAALASTLQAVLSTKETENNQAKKRKYSFKTEVQHCPHCKKGFHSQKRLEKHIPICKKNLVCSFCNKDFSGNGKTAFMEYQTHYYTHVDTKPFTCSICSRGFIRKADLDRHKIIHTDNYSPHRCTQCGAVFSSESNLAKHMHKHNRLTLNCKNCGQTFARQATLDKHIIVCQTQTSCEICGKLFTCLSKNIKSRYQEHMYIHTGERPYKCQFCERGFRDRSTRRKHERTHTGEKPYPCTVCERAFSQLRLLRNHIRTHTGEKPYTCQLCPLSFAKSCNLKYHMRVHTKEKPYTCDICKRSFTQSGTYHKHVRRHRDRSPTAAMFIKTSEEHHENGSSETLSHDAEVSLATTSVQEVQNEQVDSSLVNNTAVLAGFTSAIMVDPVEDSTSGMVPESDADQVISTETSSEAPATNTIPEISGEEITIIVSQDDETPLATIHVDQISSILASCS